jgi:cell division protein FtsI/penicillin-binding protein 2
MSFVSEKLYRKLFTVLFLALAVLTVNLHAQKKKPAELKTQIKKISPKEEKFAKQAQIDAQKNRADQIARQQAALDARRRRDEAARAVQIRKASFERSLRSVTVENISNDDTTGEDLEIRRAAVNALGNRAGTIVVLEAQTGRVLTIVNQDWAIRNSFKPCSTIKLVTAIAGLSENVIDSGGSIRPSSFNMNLDDALAFSNNAYFQRVGVNLGSTKLISYARMLGLGQPTGINAENETGGRLPFGNNNARIYSHGDDFDVTPLQLAVLVSAISNGGKVIVPQIPRDSFGKANFQGAFRRQINLPKTSLRGVIPGMIGAAEYGTARRGVAQMNVAGKTGSCIEGGSWVGLFASVAPIENPKYAVIVITRGQGERGKYAAGVAGKIYRTLRARFDEKDGRTLLAKIPADLKPQSKIDASTSAELDDAADEDSDDADSTTRKGKKGGAEIVAVSNTKPIEKPLTNPAKAAELFPPVVIKIKRDADSVLKRPRIVSNQ